MKKTLFTILFILIVFCFFRTSAQSASVLLTNNKGPKQKYLFYLHGRIIEDQGVNAVSAEYGHYEYTKILDTFRKAGFTVISEARKKNTDPEIYADKVVSQIDSLMKLDIAPQNVTVVGASKGGGITILVSEKLKNEKVNFVIMGVCSDDIEYYKNNEFNLCGNVLSIYEKSDHYGSSCENLFKVCPCIKNSKEVALNLGNSHGFLYKPYNEWIIPVIEWANENQN